MFEASETCALVSVFAPTGSYQAASVSVSFVTFDSLMTFQSSDHTLLLEMPIETGNLNTSVHLLCNIDYNSSFTIGVTSSAYLNLYQQWIAT